VQPLKRFVKDCEDKRRSLPKRLWVLEEDQEVFQRGVGSRKACGDGYPHDRRRTGTDPMGGLEEAEEDDLWRQILEGGG
jgi:hypothetical protein